VHNKSILNNTLLSSLLFPPPDPPPAMGNDGGSIPKRRELVKESARAPTTSELKATALESLSHAWTHCPLTSEALDLQNAVSDWRGRLYNYESILKNLMSGDDLSTSAPNEEEIFAATGIKSLRDVVKVKFHRADADTNGKEGVCICPISRKEFGAATKSVYLVPCGHAFAEVAIREIQEAVCPQCSEAFKEPNVIPILPVTETEVERLTKRMEGLRSEGLTHSLKKDKSASKKKKADGRGQDSNVDAVVGKRKATEELSRPGKDAGRLQGINNALAATITSRVMAEQEITKRRRMAELRS
jgi:hypothetical protein